MPKRSSQRLTKRIVDAASPGAQLWDSEVVGFGVRATKAGTRSFLVRYRAPTGQQRYSVVGPYPTLTVEEAREIARERLREVRRGGDPAALQRAVRQAPTMADLAAHYVGDYARTRDLRDKTINDARTVLQAHAIPSLGRLKVLEVTPADIRRVHGATRDKAGPYQANRLLAVLRRMFNLAAELGWRTGDNPCRNISKFPEDQRWRNLSDVEVARLLGACDRYFHQDAADAIRLLLFTGARLNELLSASWDQFDLDAGLWEKPSAHTKQKRQHRLQLDGPALDLLRLMRKRRTVGAYLFPGEPGPNGEERPRADLKRPWAWIARDAGLENVRLHDLRRTTASFMLTGGASLATVGKALGHTQAATTARYAHLADSVQREELRRAGERMIAVAASEATGVVLAFSR